MPRKRDSYGQRTSKHSEIQKWQTCSLSTRGNRFKQSSYYKEDETTVELRDTGDAQLLSRDAEDEERMFCAGQFSEDNDGDKWICCGICFKWSYALCANFQDRFFVSDVCK